jgi:hypothetical protein
MVVVMLMWRWWWCRSGKVPLMAEFAAAVVNATFLLPSLSVPL